MLKVHVRVEERVDLPVLPEILLFDAQKSVQHERERARAVRACAAVEKDRVVLLVQENPEMPRKRLLARLALKPMVAVCREMDPGDGRSERRGREAPDLLVGAQIEVAA